MRVQRMFDFFRAENEITNILCVWLRSFEQLIRQKKTMKTYQRQNKQKNKQTTSAHVGSENAFMCTLYTKQCLDSFFFGHAT